MERDIIHVAWEPDILYCLYNIDNQVDVINETLYDLKCISPIVCFVLGARLKRKQGEYWGFEWTIKKEFYGDFASKNSSTTTTWNLSIRGHEVVNINI